MYFLLLGGQWRRSFLIVECSATKPTQPRPSPVHTLCAHGPIHSNSSTRKHVCRECSSDAADRPGRASTNNSSTPPTGHAAHPIQIPRCIQSTFPQVDCGFDSHIQAHQHGLHGLASVLLRFLLIARCVQVYYAAKKAKKEKTTGQTYNDGYDDENNDYIIKPGEVLGDRLAQRYWCHSCL